MRRSCIFSLAYRIRSNTMAGSIKPMGLFGAVSIKILGCAGSIRERILFMLCWNLFQYIVHVLFIEINF